jgi:hypothetical protein
MFDATPATATCTCSFCGSEIEPDDYADAGEYRDGFIAELIAKAPPREAPKAVCTFCAASAAECSECGEPVPALEINFRDHWILCDTCVHTAPRADGFDRAVMRSLLVQHVGL